MPSFGKNRRNGNGNPAAATAAKVTCRLPYFRAVIALLAWQAFGEPPPLLICVPGGLVPARIDSILGRAVQPRKVITFLRMNDLEAISKRDFRKIGVLYRQGFSPFVRESGKYLGKENLEITGICLDCDGREKTGPGNVLKRLQIGMDSLAELKAEVVWMLSDNALLNETTLKNFWLTRFKDYRLPLVVPVPNLAGLEVDLGMFSVCPDYRQLGAQSAQQIIQVFESGASPADVGMEPLISVQMTLNQDVADRIKWELIAEKMQRINTILKRK